MKIFGTDIENLVNLLITACCKMLPTISIILEDWKGRKDILIMSSLSHGGFGKKLPNPRRGVKYLYTFHNHQTCREAFKYVYDVKEHTLEVYRHIYISMGSPPGSMAIKGKRHIMPLRFMNSKRRTISNSLCKSARDTTTSGTNR